MHEPYRNIQLIQIVVLIASREMLREKDTVPLLLFSLSQGADPCLTREEPILVYDNPKWTAIQRYSLLKAQFLEDGRLNMPIAGLNNNTNAHRRPPEHRGKPPLAIRETVEVIGWVYIVTTATGRYRRPYEEVSAEARTANLPSNRARG